MRPGQQAHGDAEKQGERRTRITRLDLWPSQVLRKPSAARNVSAGHLAKVGASHPHLEDFSGALKMCPVRLR
jgi:hypothetical protein